MPELTKSNAGVLQKRVRWSPGSRSARIASPDSERSVMSDAVMSSSLVSERVAGAPISWGVCEVPNWGHQLEPERVLSEMRSLGLAATEFGPLGFLKDDPVARAEQLRAYGLTAVGGFLPVLLHDARHDPLPEVDAFIDGCLASGAGVVVLAAFTGVDGYDARPVLDDDEWSVMLANLDRINDRAAERRVIACVHPHVGTMVETGEETERVLAGSRIGLCVDTGHLLVGGADPVALTARHPERVVHVHLKDVNGALAARVMDGTLTFGEAVRAGMFMPLGEGDVDIASLVRTLEAAEYHGWYVLEQDVMLDEPGSDHIPVAGPVGDVRKSLQFLHGVAP
jgi:inosose dehydratase